MKRLPLVLALGLLLIFPGSINAGKTSANCSVARDMSVGGEIWINVAYITPRGQKQAIVYFVDQGPTTVQRVDTTDLGPPYGDNGSVAIHYSHAALAIMYVQPDPGLHIVTVTATSGGRTSCSYVAVP